MALFQTKNVQEVEEVWQKVLEPDKTPYSTQNMIDVYLIQKYKDGYRDYRGGNPIKSLIEEPKLTKRKIKLLTSLYKDVKLLESNHILHNPVYARFKKTVNLKDMSKSIENIEEEYRNEFNKYFWNMNRKNKFSKALKSFDKKAELTDDMYNDIMKEAFDV